MTPSERKANGKIGGLVTASRHDPRDYTAAARATYLASFGNDVPADLPVAERERRIRAARRARMAELTRLSIVARSKKKAGPDRDSGPADATEGRTSAPNVAA